MISILYPSTDTTQHLDDHYFVPKHRSWITDEVQKLRDIHCVSRVRIEHRTWIISTVYPGLDMIPEYR